MTDATSSGARFPSWPMNPLPPSMSTVGPFEQLAQWTSTRSLTPVYDLGQIDEVGRTNVDTGNLGVTVDEFLINSMGST